MERLTFSITVNAPAEHVFTTMLADETYREWTAEFHPGSHYQGGWDVGDTIRFVGPNDDGTLSGMIATVLENRAAEYVSLLYLGVIDAGEDDTTSASARKFIGSYENYTFSEADGATTVTVDIDVDEDFASMFTEEWPKALGALKRIAER
ncbi:MAG: hypothetical protein QOI02_671 [Actinomycetota bacterium]|nr:hypothetical protein [Actinomycetota bacterium]